MNKFLAALMLSAITALAAPSNDNFANAQVLQDDVVVMGTTIGATTEPGDLGPYSVWYKWTPSSYGFATISASGANGFAGLMNLYVGTTLGNRVFLRAASVNGSILTNMQISSIVGGGLTYYIRISTRDRPEDGGTFGIVASNNTSGYQQSLFQNASYSNDYFANAIALSGGNVKAVGYQQAATREAGEPLQTGESTVWWKWTAPSTGTTVFSTAGSEDSHCYLLVGKGAAISNLEILGYNNQTYTYSEFSLSTVAGTDYYIASGRRSSSNDAAAAVLTILHSGGGGPSSVSTPTISPNGGSFKKSVKVTIRCSTNGAIIYFTTDGSEPTASSAKYKKALALKSSATIKAKAYKTGLSASSTASATFTKSN